MSLLAVSKDVCLPSFATYFPICKDTAIQTLVFWEPMMGALKNLTSYSPAASLSQPIPRLLDYRFSGFVFLQLVAP